MEEKEKKILNNAPLAKAMLGYFIDFLISFGLMLILNMALAPKIADSFGLQGEIDKLESFVNQAHFARVSRVNGSFKADIYYYGIDNEAIDDEGRINKSLGKDDEAYVGLYPFQAYSDIVYGLYTNFYYENEQALILTLNGEAKALTEFADKNAYLKFVGEEIFQIKNDDTSLYSFALKEDSSIDYSKKPILNQNNETVKGLENADASKKNASINALNAFWVGESMAYANSGVYGKVFAAFFNHQPVYQSVLSKANNYIYYSHLIFRFSCPIIFIFLIPLIVPEGRSIGRLIAKTKVVTKEGEKAPKWRIAIHQGVILLFWLSGFIPNNYLFYSILGLLPFVEVMVLMGSKDNRTIHEKLAGTTTIEIEQPLGKAKKEREAEPPLLEGSSEDD